MPGFDEDDLILDESDEESIEKFVLTKNSDNSINAPNSGFTNHLTEMLQTNDLYGHCDAQTFQPKAIYRAMFRRNTIAIKQAAESATDGGSKLKRVLQWYHLMGYGFASTVGAGIFVVAGQVANQYAGPAIVFSFLIAAFSSLLSAFCYSEYAVRVPLSGSAYTFSYVTLGEVIGWFIGWNLTLEYAISASAIARSWANYLETLWNQLFPEHAMWLALNQWNPFGETAFSPLSCVIIVLCTMILIVGVQESAWVNMIMTVFNVILILFIIIVGAIYVDFDNWVPFAPYGVEGVFKGAAVVFFSYVGFDAVTTLAGEVENTKRDLPLGIVGTLSFVTLLYVAVSLVITGMLPYYQIDPDAGLSEAFSSVGNNWASILVGFGSVTTLSATTFASLLGQPRIFYQMADDGLFFSIFSKVTKNGVPAFGTIISGSFALIFAFFLTLGELTDMISIGTLMAFAVVCAGVVVLRHQNPKKPKQVPLVMILYTAACILSSISIIYRWPMWSWIIYFVPCVILAFSFYIFPVQEIPQGFKTPLVPLVPCLGIYINLFLIFSLSVEALLRVFLWTLIGLLIYFCYGIRYSKQGAYNRLIRTESYAVGL